MVDVLALVYFFYVNREDSIAVHSFILTLFLLFVLSQRRVANDYLFIE